MRELIVNEDAIKKKDVTETVTRVKALLLYKKNILLGYSHNTYQFPGGHVELGEKLESALCREVLEETGIVLKKRKYSPFLVLKNYNKNYPKVGKNRLSIIYYYIIMLENYKKHRKPRYTYNEMLGNFELRVVPFDGIENILKENVELYPDSEWITNEMMEVISEYNNRSRGKIK